MPVRAIVVPGLLIGAAGAALLTRITPASGYAGLVLPAELLIGIGLGLSVMPLFATATRDAGVWAAAVLVLAALTGGALITTRPGRTR